jgi:NTE family protein
MTKAGPPPERELSSTSPVRRIPGDPPAPEIEQALSDEIGLCLSGGGYRAMLFHLGALWRLNEAGILAQLARISSVSGGSITAGFLGLNWSKLHFDQYLVARNFIELIVNPLRRLANSTIDIRAVISGLVIPGVSIGERIAAAYRKALFGSATLQDLPDQPRFVINATNVQSGVLWRFSKPYMADYRVGMIENATVSLATAVAASSAFPPFLSPVLFRLSERSFKPNSGHDLQRWPFTVRVVLSDGGVYDNLGLETVWKKFRSVLVSDGGGQLQPDARPMHNWLSHGIRIAAIVDNQVRSLRKRQLIDAYKNGVRLGAYWGIRTNIADYGLRDALPFDFERTQELAATPTRLKGMPDLLQERLINWGYTVCDAALRRHFRPDLPRPNEVPYPASGI